MTNQPSFSKSIKKRLPPKTHSSRQRNVPRISTFRDYMSQEFGEITNYDYPTTKRTPNFNFQNPYYPNPTATASQKKKNSSSNRLSVYEELHNSFVDLDYRPEIQQQFPQSENHMPDFQYLNENTCTQINPRLLSSAAGLTETTFQFSQNNPYLSNQTSYYDDNSSQNRNVQGFVPYKNLLQETYNSTNLSNDQNDDVVEEAWHNEDVGQLYEDSFNPTQLCNDTSVITSPLQNNLYPHLRPKTVSILENLDNSFVNGRSTLYSQQQFFNNEDSLSDFQFSNDTKQTNHNPLNTSRGVAESYIHSLQGIHACNAAVNRSNNTILQSTGIPVQDPSTDGNSGPFTYDNINQNNFTYSDILQYKEADQPHETLYNQYHKLRISRQFNSNQTYSYEKSIYASKSSYNTNKSTGNTYSQINNFDDIPIPLEDKNKAHIVFGPGEFSHLNYSHSITHNTSKYEVPGPESYNTAVRNQNTSLDVATFGSSTRTNEDDNSGNLEVGEMINDWAKDYNQIYLPNDQNNCQNIQPIRDSNYIRRLLKYIVKLAETNEIEMYWSHAEFSDLRNVDQLKEDYNDFVIKFLKPLENCWLKGILHPLDELMDKNSGNFLNIMHTLDNVIYLAFTQYKAHMLTNVIMEERFRALYFDRRIMGKRWKSYRSNVVEACTCITQNQRREFPFRII